MWMECTMSWYKYAALASSSTRIPGEKKWKLTRCFGYVKEQFTFQHRGLHINLHCCSLVGKHHWWWHLPASPCERLPSLPGAVLPISPYNHNPAEKWLSISHVLFPQDDGLTGSRRLSVLMAALAVCDNTHFVVLQLWVTTGSPHTSNSIEWNLG